jgi:hypothetical protein
MAAIGQLTVERALGYGLTRLGLPADIRRRDRRPGWHGRRDGLY